MDAQTLKMFEASFLSKATRKSEVISRMGELHGVLRDMPQLEPNERPVGFEKTAAQLISQRILGNSDKDVRLLACCCIVDMFRVSAPDIPFSDDECVKIFDAFVAQLRGLSTCDPATATGQKIIYILHSLATVNTCVLPVILSHNGVSGAAEIVNSMFQVLIESVHQDHDEEVTKLMSSVLHSCLEESEEIEQDLLDLLLTPLLPASKSDNISAYTLVGHVLRSCPVNVQSTISVFLNNVLVGAPSAATGGGGSSSKSGGGVSGSGSGSGDSELSDSIYPLIYELHKVSPELLLKVLPNICVQLQAEDEEIRLKAVKLLGRLFASQYASYGLDFSRNFREFLGRFVDVSAAVRQEMVDCGSLIMKRKPALRDLTMEHLVSRLRDHEADVRQNTLQHLLEIAIEDPSRLSEAAIVEMGARVKDRRVDIRKAAMIGLAKMYNRHVSAVLPELTSLREWKSVGQQAVAPNVLARLRIVPGLILNCWSYPELTVKHLVLNLLQEYLLPKSDKIANAAANDADGDDGEQQQQQQEGEGGEASTKGKAAKAKAAKAAAAAAAKAKAAIEPRVDLDARRMLALLMLDSFLSPDERGMLSSVLAYKQKVRRALTAFLDAREGTTSFQQSHALKNSMVRLLKELPAGDGKDKKSMQLLERLHVMKDKNVFRLLRQATFPHANAITHLQSRDDLRSRVDSKSLLGEYIGRVYDVAGSMCVSSGMASLVLQLLGAEPIEATGGTAAAVLGFATRHASEVYEGSADSLRQWLEATRASKQQHRAVALHQREAYQIMSRAAVYLSAPDSGEDGDAGGDESSCNELVETILACSKEWHHVDSAGAEMARSYAALAVQLACYAEALASSGGGKKKQQQQRLSQLEGTPMDAVSEALLLASSSKRLSLANNKRIGVDLMMIAGLLEHPLSLPGVSQKAVDAAYAAHIDRRLAPILKIRRFVTEEVLKQPQGPECVPASLEAWTAAVSASEQALEIAAAGGSQASSQEDADAAATTSPMSEADGDDDDDEVSSIGAKGSFRAASGAKPHVDALLTCLFGALECEGSHVGSSAVSAAGKLRMHVFRTAAKCALNLVKRPSVGRQLTTDAWKKLGWSLTHADDEVRSDLVEYLFKLLQTTSVHLRFLVYPLLLVPDAKYSARAEHALLFNVTRLRRTHDVISERAVAEESESLHRRARDNMPENVLPYVLYLLSYHPDFPTTTTVESDSDKKKLRKMATIIRAAVKVLADTLGGEENNIAFLLKQVTMIQAHYEDKYDVENMGLHFVTRLTTKILNERVRTDDNVQEYRGDVSLPMELFKLRSDAVKPGLRGAAHDAIVNAVQEGMLEAESAIDRALAGKKAGAAGGRSSVGEGRFSTGGGGGRRASTAPGEGGAVGGAKKQRAAKPAKQPKRAKSPVPEVEAARKMPRRDAKGAEKVSYEEEDEDEDEVEAWEQLAALRQAEAEAQKEERRSSSQSQSPDSSPVSTSPVRRTQQQQQQQGVKRGLSESDPNILTSADSDENGASDSDDDDAAAAVAAGPKKRSKAAAASKKKASAKKPVATSKKSVAAASEGKGKGGGVKGAKGGKGKQPSIREFLGGASSSSSSSGKENGSAAGKKHAAAR